MKYGKYVCFGKNAENVAQVARDIERRASFGEAEGFTLIEVLAVLAIVGVVVAVAAVNLLPSDEEVARRESALLALAIEGARDDAWFGGRPTAVTVDDGRFREWRLAADRTWKAVAGREHALAPGMRIAALHVDGQALPESGRLVFLSDGFGVPFRLALEVRGLARAIEGDAVGAVRVVER